MSLAFVVIARTAGAVPGPLITVVDLIKRADVVAMGTVVGVKDEGAISVERGGTAIPGRSMSGLLVIDQVLKGPATLTSAQFRFTVTDEFIGYRSVAAGDYRIFFLKHRDADYEFASPYYPAIPAVPNTPVIAGGPSERVLEAEAAVLRSREANVGLKREAIYALRELDVKSLIAVSALRFAVQERDQSVRQTAIAALLASGDASAIQFAEAALLRSDGDTSPDFLASLRVTISLDLDVNAATIPTLGRLLTQGDAETRLAVSWGLGRARSQLALRLLAAALDDPDIKVRHNAVMGLAKTTGQLTWGPSMDEFVNNQARYLDHWKEWSGWQR
jgi:hypothetical protein